MGFTAAPNICSNLLKAAVEKSNRAFPMEKPQILCNEI